MVRKRRPYFRELLARDAAARIPSMQGRARFAWRGNMGCRTRRFRFPIPPEAPAPPKPEALLEGFCPEPRAEEQIAVNCDGRLLLLRLDDIDWLEAAGDRAALHVGGETYLLDVPFLTVLGKLPPRYVMRLKRRSDVRSSQRVSHAGLAQTRHPLIARGRGGVAKVCARAMDRPDFNHDRTILRKASRREQEGPEHRGP